MNKQRIFIVICFVLAFSAMTGWLLYSAYKSSTTQFMAGSPPLDIMNLAIPQTISLSSMRPPAVQLTDHMRFGGPEAAGTVILFGSYSCEECKKIEKSITDVVPKYGGKVRYVWRDLPDEKAKYDSEAALYAFCAGIQGKFWEVHDALMAEQRVTSLSFDYLTASLKMDRTQIATCMREQKFVDEIKTNADLARSDGVTTTPVFFIGTDAYASYLPPNDLDKKIKEFMGS
ncbi:MAG: thioredoxin domain-containing protein [Patescibacteria group bacterium]|nr:thioredoxin domain-containing protein [Patescibacteria group bacterium]